MVGHGDRRSFPSSLGHIALIPLPSRLVPYSLHSLTNSPKNQTVYLHPHYVHNLRQIMAKDPHRYPLKLTEPAGRSFPIAGYKVSLKLLIYFTKFVFNGVLAHSNSKSIISIIISIEIR